MSFTVKTLEDLQSLFSEPSEVSLKKEVTYLHPLYQELIKAAPFVVMATANEQSLETSPRGDPAGFVHIEDDHTLMLPERKGNNRIDSLKNIIADPRVALLFLIPGLGETLRVTGRAEININPELLQRFAVDGKPPKCVLIIRVEKVLFQCARAIYRSNLWAPVVDRPNVPTPGKILDSITRHEFDGAAYDNDLKAKQLSTLY